MDTTPIDLEVIDGLLAIESHNDDDDEAHGKRLKYTKGIKGQALLSLLAASNGRADCLLESSVCRVSN